jgi:transcriptional regulator GlxA family with amidase domain
MRELVELFTQRGSAPPATIGMAAAQIISSTNGRIAADAVASALGCCTRHLRREMISDIGIGPKTAARISRIRCAIALLGASTTPLAQVALDAGYSDQAHMTRDFAFLEAPSPATMRSWIESDSFNTLNLLIDRQLSI